MKTSEAVWLGAKEGFIGCKLSPEDVGKALDLAYKLNSLVKEHKRRGPCGSHRICRDGMTDTTERGLPQARPAVFGRHSEFNAWDEEND